jgi:hypothetical protein
LEALISLGNNFAGIERKRLWLECVERHLPIF